MQFTNPFPSLLGMGSNQPDPYQSLLGEYYDPRQARMAWLGGTLQGLGAGLASGKSGAWAEGLALGGGEGLDNYRQRAVAGYALKQRKDEQDYQKQERDRKAAEEQAQKEAQAAAIAGLPPEMQSMAKAFPNAVIPSYVKNKYFPGGGEFPTSVQEYQYAVQQGFKGSLADWKKQGGGGLSLGIGPDGQLTLMPGGGGGSNSSLPAELGGRMGMGEQFLQTDVPAILPGIERGDATGPIDYVQGVFGRGEAGNIHRRMASGADALRRGLTGAGMGVSESGEYADRYLPVWSDDAATLASKLKSLEADLNAVKNGALAGKTGNLAAFLPSSQMFVTPAAPAAAANAAPPPAPKVGDVVQDTSAIPEGAVVVDESGVAYRMVNGQLQKVQ